MSLRVRYQYVTGAVLSYAIERMSDRYDYDFNDSTFKNTTPVAIRASLVEDTLHPGIYEATLSPTPTSQFTDGDYAIYISDSTNNAIAVSGVVMTNGDDTTVIPSGGVAVLDARIEAFMAGDVTVDEATGKETFHAKDNRNVSVMRFEPDGSNGRVVVDLRGV